MSGSGYTGSLQLAATTNVTPQDVPFSVTTEQAINPYVPPKFAAAYGAKKTMAYIAPFATPSSENGLTVYKFKPDKDHDLSLRLWLRITVAALAATGATYQRLVEWYPLWAVDHIDILDADSLVVQTIRPSLTTFRRIMETMTDEQRTKIADQLGGNLTPAERNTRALAPQTFYLPIDTWWFDDQRKALAPITLNEYPTFNVYLRPDTQTVQTDGTPPVGGSIVTYPTAPTLVIERGHVLKHIRTQIMQRIGVPEGVQYAHSRPREIGLLTILSGTTEYSAELRTLSGPNIRINWDLQPVTQTNTNYQYDPFTFTPSDYPTSVKITANQQDLLAPIDAALLKLATSHRYSGRDTTLRSITYAEVPEHTNLATGHLSLNNLNNPVLVLTWATPTTRDLRLRIYGIQWTIITQVEGTLRSIFM